MSELSPQQLVRVMTMPNTFWNPTLDFIYHQELFCLWDTDLRPVIIKNADQILDRPAFELTLLAQPLMKLQSILEDIPCEWTEFKNCLMT